MVLDVGGYLRGTGSDDWAITEEAVRAYHACLEAGAEVDQSIRNGDMSMEVLHECGARIAAVRTALEQLQFPPGSGEADSR